MESQQQIISPSNQGPLLTTIAWAFFVPMLIANVTKVWNRWLRTRQLKLDDILQATAVAIAIAQTIVINAKVSAGFGRRHSDLDGHQLTQIEKLGYSAQILYTAVLCLTKISTSVFIMELAPINSVVLSMRIFLAFLSAWFPCAVIVIAFQSGLPNPWDFLSGKGAKMGIFWGFFGAIDILTELWLVLLPTLVLGILQTARNKKIEIISVFMVRLLNLPLTILRLVYIIPASDSHSLSTSMLHSDIVTEVHMHMGLVLASVPFIKTILESMQHGMIAGDHTYASSRNDNSLATPSISLHKITNAFTRSTARTVPSEQTDSPQQIDAAVHPYRELEPRTNSEAQSLNQLEDQTGRPRQGSDTIAVTTIVSTHLERP